MDGKSTYSFSGDSKAPIYYKNLGYFKNQQIKSKVNAFQVLFISHDRKPDSTHRHICLSFEDKEKSILKFCLMHNKVQRLTRNLILHKKKQNCNTIKHVM